MQAKRLSSLSDFTVAFVYGVLFVFFLQLLTDFVAAIYAFGLLGTDIPPEIVFVLLFFSPILLFLSPRGISDKYLMLLGVLVLVCRLIEPMLDTRARLLISGIGVASFLVFFPAMLHNLGRNKSRSHIAITAGLTLATGTLIVFRVLNSGIDLTVFGWGRIIAWALALIVFLILLSEFRRIAPSQVSEEDKQRAPFGRIAGLSLGLMGVFAILYFAFAAPHVISRWTETDYIGVVVVIYLVLLGFAWAFVFRSDLLVLLSRRAILTWNALFVLALFFTIWQFQIHFPMERGAYPIYESAVPPGYLWVLFALLFLFPVILVDCYFYTRELIALRPTMRQLAGGFTLAALFLVVMVFAHVFTTVYAYIPVVGPFFRDKFWLVYLVAGLSVLIPGFLLERRPSGRRSQAAPGAIFVSLALLGALAFIGVILRTNNPPFADVSKVNLKVLTYNIQQGYNQNGELNIEGQLDLIRTVDADLIALQESDSARISGGNNDIVRYIADGLGYYSYYGPKTVTGTFGIALLSRYPIENPSTFYMYSLDEQTATILAEIELGGRWFNIFVTHLGNGGPIEQQQDLLGEITGKENVVAVGDFNFDPGSEQYQLTTNLLEDAWLLKWPSGVDDLGGNPTDRIDHVFVSPGTKVSDARFIDSPASDHPALWVVIQW